MYVDRVSPPRKKPGHGAHRLLGFLAARVVTGELHINNIAVREEYRRCGVGSLFLRQALREAPRRGAKRIMLEVRGGNYPAIKLYQKYGFKVWGKRERYYQAPEEDALIMGREAASSILI